MTRIAAHLSVEALRDRYVSSADLMEARHFQTIWLLAKGHGVGDVAEMTSFGQRWIEQLVVRYNAEGPDALGDLRRRNGSTARVLTPEVLAKLRVHLKEPPVERRLAGARHPVRMAVAADWPDPHDLPRAIVGDHGECCSDPARRAAHRWRRLPVGRRVPVVQGTRAGVRAACDMKRRP